MTEVINSISDFEKYLKNTKKIVEEALDFSLGPENPEILRESMRYSLLAGGKRIRPILCLASCSLAGGCLLYTSPSPRDLAQSRMPSSA